ncbi:hypothetical protein TNCV_743421 [Trichonephila clavipes]|nr:hypothetical protein TNCV_743421 [Trichonephila clavipes]
MGKRGDISPCKKAEVKALVNAKLYSNREISRRFATTKVIKSQLQDINVNAPKRTVRRKLKHLNFKTCRPSRKRKLTPAMKAKRLYWAKQWRDKDVDFWRSECTLVCKS